MTIDQPGSPAPSMGARTPDAVHRAFFQAYADQDLPAVQDLLAEHFVAHFGGQELGREAYAEFVRGFYVGFPDLTNRMEQQVTDGELVASRTVWSGTHRGDFLGVPATDRRVTFEALSLSRVTNGRIAEHWFIGDLLSVLQQVGGMASADRS